MLKPASPTHTYGTYKNRKKKPVVLPSKPTRSSFINKSSTDLAVKPGLAGRPGPGLAGRPGSNLGLAIRPVGSNAKKGGSLNIGLINCKNTDVHIKMDGGSGKKSGGYVTMLSELPLPEKYLTKAKRSWLDDISGLSSDLDLDTESDLNDDDNDDDDTLSGISSLHTYTYSYPRAYNYGKCK